MEQVDTFGITLPVATWRRLFRLSHRAQRRPSDFIDDLIAAEADRQGVSGNSGSPAPRKDPSQVERVSA